ncbi:hypothetical protein VTN00DRAFT_995 [Thermoascus crustaceus]|uniref:uncharacterized protein n=1 Tax=Thermoascus crustaceus TaxID=5088 RepID=UPI0037422120
MDAFWSAPPVSRTLTALTFLQSALVYGGLLDGYLTLFLPKRIFRFPPEIWRLFSPFLLTGSGLSFFFDLYFMFTYGSSLESGSPRFSIPSDFFTYVIFVGVVILLTAGYLLSNIIFTHALIIAFVYTFAQDNRGRKVNYLFVTLPVELLPWAMLTLTLVISGWPAALCDGMGIIAAHLYDFLTRIYPTFGGGKNYIVTPGFVKKLFGADVRREAHRTYGTAYRPSQQPQRGSASGGWTSSFGGSWSGRGAGRRLGGD